MTDMLNIALAAIAAIVAAGLARKKNMWGWIALYWIALTIRNILAIL